MIRKDEAREYDDENRYEDAVEIPDDNDSEDREEPDAINQDNMNDRRRGTRIRSKPIRYEVEYQNCMMAINAPASRNEALCTQEAELWRRAELEEISSHEKNETWRLVRKPDGVNIVGSKWVYALKNDENGKVKTYKARLCAKGYSQEYCVDFHDTFAPVISPAGLRLVFAIGTHLGKEIHHMDVKTAFLNAKLNEKVFMEQPEGYEQYDETGEKYVCELKRAIYGLKQAGRERWTTITHYLESKLNFKKCSGEPCLLIRRTQNCFTLLALYVDDLILTATNADELLTVKRILNSLYHMKDLGKATHV